MLNTVGLATRFKQANPRHVLYTQWQWKGYHDALNGLPLRHDDAPDAVCQKNYERARFWIFNMKAAGIRPPSWRERSWKPTAIIGAVRQAQRIAGKAMPPSNRPPAAVQR